MPALNPRFSSRFRKVVGGLLASIALIAAIFTIIGRDIFDLRARVFPQKYTILVPLYSTTDEYLRFMRGESPEFSREIATEVLAAVDLAKANWVNSVEAQQSDRVELMSRVEFFFFPEGVSDASYPRAFQRAMEIQKERDREVVASIGHVTSTATENYAALYADENLPLVLPLATATSLIDSLSSQGVEAVRLVPNNRKQAQRIARFLLGRETDLKEGWGVDGDHLPRVIVATDMSNSTYSSDLLDEFRNYFSRLPFKESQRYARGGVRHGQILASIPLGANSTGTLMASSLRELSPDALVLFGMTELALEVMAQAEAAGATAPLAVMTDGAIDDYLLPRVDAIRSEGRRIRSIQANGTEPPVAGEKMIVTGLDRLLLSFPMSQDDWQRWETISTTTQPRMSHGLYVMDAAQILIDAIKRYEEGSLLTQRNPRRFIASEFRRWKQEGSITATLTHGRSRQYRIDSRGENLKDCYHLWGIEENDKGNLVWELLTPGECPSEQT